MEKFGASFSGRSYLMSVTPLKVVTLADNNNTDNSNGSSCNCKGAFSPSLPVVMLVLFGIFLFTCFFSICARRRSTNWDRRGARSNGNNIIEVISREVARGLKRADIESFPIFSYNLVKGIQAQAKCSECAVCLSDFAEDEMLRLLPKCSHAFHPECIDEWLFTHTTCPLCRTSLVLADDSIPTPADFGLVEPQAPPEEITVIIDNGGGVSLRMDISNDEATNGGPGYDLMGYSLVRVRKEIEQPTEWYIATAEGLTRGLHRSCSFVGAHHSHESSGSNAPPACSKPGGFVGEAGHRSRSERWGSISMKPASVLRTFSMGILPRARGQVGVEQQDDKARLKGKFSSLMGRDREGDGTELSQSGSLSYRYADQSGSCSAE